MNSHIWNADNGDGTYSNPILYTDYSDPDAIRVGDDYYMIASSFSNVPGIPILHSKDLVNWELINYVLAKLPDARYDKPVHGCGVWAPAIRYHNGLYFVCFPMPDEGIYMSTATDPYAAWTKPVCIRPGAGWIDPCPFWDEDGRAYLVAGVAKSRMGYNNVLFLSEMKPDGMGLIGPEVKIYDGDTSQQNTVEGPKLYKRNGWYYIFAPAGGVKIGWQIVLRSRNIWGPYDSRIVMMQGDSTVNGPHQGAWVNTPDGEDWFLHFQDVYAAGRIIHLQPMTWQEDWPVIGAAKEGQSYGEPVASFRKPHASTSADSITMVTSDDFADGQLNPAWQWNANPKPEWYHCSPHRLVLRAIAKAEVYADQPNLLLQKWPAPDFRCIYKLDLSGLTEGDEAGVISLGTDYGLVAFERIAQGYRVRSILGTQHFGKILVDTTTEQATEQAMIEGCQSTVYVKYIVEPCGTRDLNETEKGFPSERVRILYSVDGTIYTEALVMTSMPGRWVGTKNGLFCVHRQNKYKAMSDGHCLVEYVHYER